MFCGVLDLDHIGERAVSAPPIVPQTGIRMTDRLVGAHEKMPTFRLSQQKRTAQIAARFQRLTESSRFQNEKRGNRVVLKVKIESF
jgi:hypothetical protein